MPTTPLEIAATMLWFTQQNARALREPMARRACLVNLVAVYQEARHPSLRKCAASTLRSVRRQLINDPEMPRVQTFLDSLPAPHLVAIAAEAQGEAQREASAEGPDLGGPAA